MANKKKVKKTKEIKKSKYFKKSKANGDLANFNFFNPANKSQLVLKNLIVFVALFFFSLIGLSVSTNEIFVNLFKIIIIISIGFIFGLITTLLILLLLKNNKK